ncbi:BON domain-containing protein, partial [Hydrogenophaga sp.]|uniref:BON domain-containing protein n=1 Tax=Hydrogenophaga sp. TaxID=1904254 RepID=UPI00271C6FBF
SVAESATDMAITTKVNAALAADDQLSALKIDVDTEAGNVALTGTAPDEASRARATTLTAAVDGVVTVDNRLTVEKNS